MSEEFEASQRAIKRRRTNRHSDQTTVLDDGSKGERDATIDTSDDVDEQAPNASDTIEVHVDTNVRTTSSKKAKPRRAKAHTNSVDTTLSSDDHVSTPVPKGSRTHGPSSRKSTSAQKQRKTSSPAVNEEQAAEPSEAGTVQLTTRSSGRARRPPKRLVDSLDAKTPTKTSVPKAVARPVDIISETASPAPKGILTPSRKQKPKVQKSVAFSQEEKEIEEQLGFRDIDTPASTKKLPQKSTPYPSRSLNLSKARATEVLGSENRHQTIQPQESVEPVLIDEFLDTVPVPQISTTPTIVVSSSNEDPRFSSLKRQVLRRLTSASLPATPPKHLDSQYGQLYSLLKSTVASSESNSLLLLGPRGSGKTMLLDLAIRDLEDDFSSDFHTVRLNGFLQTDDRLALREIWRQLGYSRNLEEDETEDIGASYADTMASLLSLLSHADEMLIDDADEVEPTSSTDQRTTKSIVFILDEFDLFTTHPRQTLLYNLFDIAQSRKAPIVVVGCSSRMDVIECLEKRVKSRFSHRWILVPGCKSLPEWEAEVKSALVIQNRETEQAKLADKDQECIEDWNRHIESNFLSHEDIQRAIKREFYTTKSLPQLYIALYPLVTALQLDSRTSSQNKVGENQEAEKKMQVALSPSVLIALKSLPVLHMSLLISMCRLETMHTLTTVNFNLAYTHYTELIDAFRLKQTAHGSVTHSGSLRKWNRELCREVWEELGIEGMIVPVAGGRDEEGNNGGAEMEETRMWRSEVDLDDILWSVKEKFDMHDQGGGGAGEILVKWCKEA